MRNKIARPHSICRNASLATKVVPQFSVSKPEHGQGYGPWNSHPRTLSALHWLRLFFTVCERHYGNAF